MGSPGAFWKPAREGVRRGGGLAAQTPAGVGGGRGAESPVKAVGLLTDAPGCCPGANGVWRLCKGTPLPACTAGRPSPQGSRENRSPALLNVNLSLHTCAPLLIPLKLKSIREDEGEMERGVLEKKT